MTIVRLDHYNLAPNDMEATVKFYEDVVGLHVGDRPDFGVDGYWLYAGEQAVLHLLEEESRSTGPTGRLDHVAFWATDLASHIERLQKADLQFMLRTVEVAGMHQLFFKDVDGVTIEIGFPSNEPVPDTVDRRMGL
jgi:catechol 2,3-dioxygenase-like lactoylglutathione lyase family enzyme|tara:strand:- start:127 stop:534 length:408 start_codon:yes stop_codon:yes gene_type:complete